MPRASANSDVAPLSRETVLATALELIDRNGVDGFSVRDLARTLGVYPTALYWHVPSRNALIAGAVAQAIGDLPTPKLDGDWRAELVALFACYRRAVRVHPRIAPVLGAQLVSNESMSLALVDQILALLEGAGFEGPVLRNAFNVVIAAMVGFVTMELAPLPADDPQGWADAHRQHLEEVDAETCPTFVRHRPQLVNKAFVLRWTSGGDHPLDESFDAWCRVIVDGLEVLLATTKKAPATRARDAAVSSPRASSARRDRSP